MCQYSSNFSTDKYPSEPADSKAPAEAEAQPEPRVALSIKKAQMQPVTEKLGTQVSVSTVLFSLAHMSSVGVDGASCKALELPLCKRLPHEPSIHRFCL
jgi:hypothetical protein